jgi:hypothetical protein
MNNEENFLASEVAFSQDQGQLIMDMYRKINDLVTIINAKTTGIYNNEEYFTCERWHLNARRGQPKALYKITVDCGALPNAGTKNIAHGLPLAATWDIVNIFGVAKNPTTPIWIQIGEKDMTVDINATNIVITTLVDFSAYTTSYVTIVYIKP